MWISFSNNYLPSNVLTEESIVNDLTSGGTDKPLSAEQGRTLNSHVNYTTCGSNAGDQVKLISDDGFELSTHLRLLVKMNNTNTNSAPRFNINNTGIKNVWYNGAAASDTNTWSVGEVLDVYYDGTKYITNTHGGAQFSTGQKVSDMGIDNEPTAGSDNLVKSSGVYDIHTYEIALNNNLLLNTRKIDLSSGSFEIFPFVYNRNKIVSTNDSSHYSFLCKIDEESIYYLSYGLNCAFFNHIPKLDDAADNYESVTSITGGMYKYVLINTPVPITITKNLNLEETDSKTYYTPAYSNNGGYSSSGSELGNAYRCTDFLFAVPGVSVTGYYATLVSFFDKDKQYISSLVGTDSSSHIDTIVLSEQNIPQDAIYFVATTLASDYYFSRSHVEVLNKVYFSYIDNLIVKLTDNPIGKQN